MNEEIKGSAGTVTVQRRSGVIVITVVGQFSADATADLLRQLEAMIATERTLWLFLDLSQTTGYESLARTKATEWSLKHRAAIKNLTAWSSSAFLRMGVATFSMALSLVGLNVDTAANKTEFEALIAAAVTKKRESEK